MKKLIPAFLVVTLIVVAGLTARAQQARKSPHETITANIDGNEIKLAYGRPYAKERKIWGGLVPWGKAWRTGADEATLLTTAMPIMMGETTVPAGTYSLYTVPEETGTSKLAISKKTGQWGIPVDEKQDLARVDLKKEAIPTKVEQFTMAIEKNPAGAGGILKMMWENTQLSVPFTVKK